jgi:homoserine dehydrogenase
VTRALKEGRHVVTANKQLLAQHGDELVAAAKEGGAQFRFEAAVAGAIPVIRVVQESLGAIPIEKVFGIVNGTTNYILTEMSRAGLSYDDALKQAQDLGYAEADPTDDVGGADAAAKMAILARLAFGAPVSLDDVSYQGIEAITADDITYAKELGLSLKLLGVAERVGEKQVSVRVFPCFLFPGHPLAPIEGPFNAVMVEAPAITEITMSGPGAGVARDRVGGARRRGQRDPRRLAAVRGNFHIENREGRGLRVLSALGGRGPPRCARRDHQDPGRRRSVGPQRGSARDGRRRRLVMVMHPVSERRFGAALKKIAKLKFRAPPARSGDRGRVQLGRCRFPDRALPRRSAARRRHPW